jgi:phosphoglycolate phosphatase
LPRIPANFPAISSHYTGTMVRVLRHVPIERIKLLVFDLDGTLIDSAQDLCNSVNATLSNFGRDPLADSAIAGFIGDGALMLVRRAFAEASGSPVDEDFLVKAYDFFLDYYRAHKLDFTYAYAGVLEALAALHKLHESAAGTVIRMAVLTNKPVRPARDICEALGLAPYFLRIYGGNSFDTKKPDPAGMLALMEEAGAKPDETIMIGDSQVDVLTARNAGVWSVGCTFGLSPETLLATQPDILVDSPQEWIAALSQVKMA